MADQQPELVRDLSRPAAYGGRVRQVDFRATHASWVFLTETEVFKVKRPVDLGFLDYRTLEDRRRACLAEVRLNRRLAPDVYLGVVPVHRDDGGHTLAGDGPPVDWAVHMRRLPDGASAAARLAAGTLDAPSLEKVARRLASFLSEAATTPTFGALSTLAANVDENFAQTRPLLGDLVPAPTFAEVEAFQRDMLARHGDRFQARIAANRIREGHGDVRLEHIYFLGDGPPVIIDAIEFNDRFRCGDAAGEIAFLAMELEAARRLDLADGLIARFAEESDDFDLYRVLDFYLSYRAWVRGKVAAFVATDPATPAERRRSKEDEARRCFGLARSATGLPLDRPFLIAVGGLIASGKSTLAEQLGRVLAAPVVSSDRTRKARAGLAPTEQASASVYELGARQEIYGEILQRAGHVLQSGRGALVDASFASRRWRADAAAAARAAGATFVFVEARAPLDVLRARLAARRTRDSVSDAREDLLDAFVRDYEPVVGAEGQVTLTIDTATTGEDAARAALGGLTAAGILPAAERRRS
ncbi:MAG TPA: AAA family ATPase [Polyangia bacterium]|nr:AAA family ATPase [Polyangia bacterium]